MERMAELQLDFSQLEQTNLQVKATPLIATSSTILCDMFRGFSRSIVPSEMRREVLTASHNLAQPGIRATQRLLKDRFVWPSMDTDIRQCLACQKTKIGRHNKAPIGTFLAPDARFACILFQNPITATICSLPLTDLRDDPSQIRFQNIVADTVARAFLEHCISHYVVPQLLPPTEAINLKLDS
ncbi:hypothetical protein SprV_0802534800 [Sparganum proliferum]